MELLRLFYYGVTTAKAKGSFAGKRRWQCASADEPRNKCARCAEANEKKNAEAKVVLKKLQNKHGV